MNHTIIYMNQLISDVSDLGEETWKLRHNIRNRRHFADDSFKCIFVNENMFISINILLKFIPKGPINKIPTLVQIMAWRRPGDKPLSEPMMVSLMTLICVTRPQWVTYVGYRQAELSNVTRLPGVFIVIMSVSDMEDGSHLSEAW